MTTLATRFIQVAPDRVRCTRCGRELITSAPAEKAYCACDNVRPKRKYARRLGDWLAWLLHGLGFKMCPACDRRRQWLNRHQWRILVTIAAVVALAAWAIWR